VCKDTKIDIWLSLQRVKGGFNVVLTAESFTVGSFDEKYILKQSIK
jgi:hypothetical protein